MAQPRNANTAAPEKRAPRTLAGVLPVSSADSARAQVVANFEAALALLHQGKYDKAHAAFDSMLLVSPPEFRCGIRTYLDACLLHITKGQTTFLSHEERYDYAISLLNDGQYEDARKHFKVILDENPTADYAFYGLAVLCSMTGDANTCLEHLSQAIHHNPRNRIQARADSDFQDMADDPRFTELLYPES